MFEVVTFCDCVRFLFSLWNVSISGKPNIYCLSPIALGNHWYTADHVFIILLYYTEIQFCFCWYHTVQHGTWVWPVTLVLNLSPFVRLVVLHNVVVGIFTAMRYCLYSSCTVISLTILTWTDGSTNELVKTRSNGVFLYVNSLTTCRRCSSLELDHQQSDVVRLSNLGIGAYIVHPVPLLLPMLIPMVFNLEYWFIHHPRMIEGGNLEVFLLVGFELMPRPTIATAPPLLVGVFR